MYDKDRCFLELRHENYKLVEDVKNKFDLKPVASSDFSSKKSNA